MPPTYHVDTATVDTTTEDMPRADQLEYWGEVISSFHCTFGSRVVRPDDFQGRTTCQRAQPYQLVTWGVSTPQWLQRTKRQVHADPDERHRFVISTRGSLVLRHAGNRRTLTAGTGALFTMNTPFDLGVGPRHKGMILTMPQREIDHRLGRGALLNPKRTSPTVSGDSSTPASPPSKPNATPPPAWFACSSSAIPNRRSATHARSKPKYANTFAPTRGPLDSTRTSTRLVSATNPSRAPADRNHAQRTHSAEVVGTALVSDGQRQSAVSSAGSSTGTALLAATPEKKRALSLTVRCRVSKST
ncbi:AraC-binding-like domain-containing protein [Saccharopolyspora shandongensis]|uniref:AraC-binding-like domain-containing protein n=1 Tax=Saccharopolyspora shandongensis TaxID=418495 RepID=A0A1H3U9C9_9PSEU|nr:AraC-binding-like domain-containing protein [Saccharopolyspora shandongensis]